MALGQDLWNTITIIIALNSLHKDFNTTIVSLFQIGDKTINVIKSIL